MCSAKSLLYEITARCGIAHQQGDDDRWTPSGASIKEEEARRCSAVSDLEWRWVVVSVVSGGVSRKVLETFSDAFQS